MLAHLYRIVQEALTNIARHAHAERVSVVVEVDLSMPGLNGVEATWRLLTVSPRSRVIALTAHEEPVYASELLAAGAAGTS